MSEIQLRAILLVLIGALSLGAAVGLKYVGYVNAPVLFIVLGLVTFGAAVWILLVAED